MPAVILAVPVREYWCPNCDVVEQRRSPLAEARFHNCAGLKGVTAPMMSGPRTAVKVEAVEREDYLGVDDRNVQRDADDRPIMAVITTRDDGQDCAVLAPSAVGKVRA